MYIKPTETLTRKDVDRSHFGADDLRIHQTGHYLSWKRNEKGSAVVGISCRKPADEDYWLSISVAEYAAKSSKEAFVTLNSHSAREIYKFLHEKFKDDVDTLPSIG